MFGILIKNEPLVLCSARFLLRLLLLYSILHICPQMGMAQRIKKITTNEGLSQGFVAGVVQSQEGYIWASSLNGLNRYDGENFKVYRHDQNDSFSLSSDFVTRLFQDNDKNIWNLNNENLQMYDGETDRFITPDLFKKQRLRTNGTVMFDQQNRLWVIVDEGTVLCYSVLITRQGGQRIPVLSPLLKYQLDYATLGYVGAIFPTDTSLYFGTDKGGVYSLNLKSQQVTQVEIANTAKVTQIWEDPVFGGLWFQTTRKSIYRKNAVIRYFDVPYSNSAIKVTGLAVDGKTYLFSNREVWVWDGIQLNPTPISIPETILTACLDHQGNMWIGTNAQGLRHIELNGFAFSVIQPGVCNGHPVVIGDNSNVWIYDSPFAYHALGEYKMLSSSGELGPPLNNSKFKWMQMDDQKRIWVVDEAGVGVINKPGGPITRIQLPEHEGFPFKLFCGKNRVIWIITDQLGLIRYDDSTGKSQYLNLDTEDVFPPGAYKYAGHYSNMVEDNTGWVWLGLSAGVVGVKWSDEQQQFQKSIWNGKIEGKRVLKEHGVLSIATVNNNSSGALWIGTPSGLVHWDIATNKVDLINQRMGLPDDYIYSMVSGEGKDLWLGTNRGLVGYNPETHFSRLFTEKDGLPANEFNTSCMAVSPIDHAIYLNTVAGIIKFNPAKLNRRAVPSQMVFTGVWVNEIPVNMAEINSGQSYFKYDQNSVTIDFALLCFTNSEVNRYEYRFNGKDDGWIHLGTKNTLTFPLMSPGHYSVWVRGINSDGLVSEPIRFVFTIAWPWWKTWWAYFAYAIGIIAIIWAVFRAKSYIEEVKYSAQLKAQAAGYQAESERQRIQLLSNITHEIRTPLTIILGLSKSLKMKLTGKSLEEISLLEKGAEELFFLSNQVVQLAKGKSGDSLQYWVEGNMMLLIHQILDYFKYLAEIKSIKIELDIPEDGIWAYYDEYAIKNILSNLLSNAVKFTSQGGIVWLKTSFENDRLFLEVKDSGIGMSDDVKGKIFERFYQAEGPQKYAGTGIGLAYVMEVVDQLGGCIVVDSEEGFGSNFKVELPVKSISPPLNVVELSLPTTQLLENNYQPNSEEKPLVLIIDDNPAVAMYIGSTFGASYQIEYALDGDIGFFKAIDLIPDIIITDIMMPRTDGLELCEQLKKHHLTRHIPVVMVTALVGEQEKIEGLKVGADAYIEKPFLQEELELVIQNLLALKTRLHQNIKNEEAVVKQNLLQAPAERELITQVVLRNAAPADAEFLAQVMAIIEKSFSQNDFTLMEIQKQMAFSATQFYRKMVAATGNPAGYYLRRRRLEEALFLLQTQPDMSIKEVAYNSGFSDPNYFSTAFSTEFGHPPSFYRKN